MASRAASLSGWSLLSGLSPFLPINNHNQICIIGFRQQCNCFPSLIFWGGRSAGEKGQLCNRSFHVNAKESVVPCGLLMSAALLLSGGVKEGNHFIVLFLDFSLDFTLYDTLCTGDRAVDAQFSCKTLRFLPPDTLPFSDQTSAPLSPVAPSHPLVAASPARP